MPRSNTSPRSRPLHGRGLLALCHGDDPLAFIESPPSLGFSASIAERRTRKRLHNDFVLARTSSEEASSTVVFCGDSLPDPRNKQSSERLFPRVSATAGRMAFVAMRGALAGLLKPVLRASVKRAARPGRRRRAATRQARSLITGHQDADAAALRRVEDSLTQQFPTLTTRQLSQHASEAAGAPTAAEVGLLKQLRNFVINKFSVPPNGFGKFAKEQPQGKGNGGGGGGGGAKGEPPSAGKPEGGGGGGGGAGDSAKKSSTAAGEAAAAEGEGAAQKGGAAAGAEGEAAAAGKAGAEGEAASSSSSTSGSNSAKQASEEAGGAGKGAGGAGAGKRAGGGAKTNNNKAKRSPSGTGAPDNGPNLEDQVKGGAVIIGLGLAAVAMLSSMSTDPDQEGRTVSWQEFQNEYLQRGLVERIVVYNKAVAIADLRADANEIADVVRSLFACLLACFFFLSRFCLFSAPPLARAHTRTTRTTLRCLLVCACARGLLRLLLCVAGGWGAVVVVVVAFSR